VNEFIKALAAKDEALAAERKAKDEALAAKDKAKDEALAAERKAKDEALAAKDKAKDEALAAKDEALEAERKAKDEALAAKDQELSVAHATALEVKDKNLELSLKLRDAQPRLERLRVRFVFGASDLRSCAALLTPTPLPNVEHAASVARTETGNVKLTLKDAVLTFINKTNAEKDRVFQLVQRRYPHAQHKAVCEAYVQLVASANVSHHDMLQEISLKHPDEVFHSELQRYAFDALCSLVSPGEQD
jgi:hypothetical protein